MDFSPTYSGCKKLCLLVTDYKCMLFWSKCLLLIIHAMHMHLYNCLICMQIISAMLVFSSPDVSQELHNLKESQNISKCLVSKTQILTKLLCRAVHGVGKEVLTEGKDNYVLLLVAPSCKIVLELNLKSPLHKCKRVSAPFSRSFSKIWFVYLIIQTVRHTLILYFFLSFICYVSALFTVIYHL